MIEVNDKVICINDNNQQGIYSVIIGQIYEVSDTLVKDRIRVREKGNSYYPTNLFITVEQHRENQINKLLQAE
jgi:hypothetical protein